MTGALAPGQIARRGGALIDYLEPLLAKRGAVLDHAQVAALDRLQELADNLDAFRTARKSTLKRLFSQPEVPRCVYMWGGVGRGKSFLMDSFFVTVPVRRKTRVHFHAFMRDVHAELKTLKNEVDPLATVAARIAKRWRLICFDEFHVSDIADAMILGRLLTALFAAGVVFVMTSNYAPEDLYPNGLQRQNFVPTIKLIKTWLDVIEVNGGTDYRLRTLEQVESFHVPNGPRGDAAMNAAFDTMGSGPDESPKIVVDGRTLTARRVAGSAVWFDFKELCDGPRSQRDYLEIAQRFAVVFLSDIPVLAPDQGDLARRFTWLVDILYDHRVKFVASAAAPAQALYVAGPNVQEFPRTVSRLAEMRTHEYMARPHAADGAPHPAPVPA
jgi:cell division protein ZapE